LSVQRRGQRIRTNHFDSTQTALSIPKNHDEAGGKQQNQANHQENNRQQRSYPSGLRCDIK